MTPYPKISKNIVFVKVNDSDKYLLKLNGKVFYVSEFLHFIISELTRETPVSIIIKMINETNRFSRPLNADDLEKIIIEKICPLNLDKEGVGKDVDSRIDIKHRLVFLNFREIRPFLHYAKFLFPPSVFLPLLIASAMLSGTFFLCEYNKTVLTNFKPIFYLIAVPSFLAIAFLHELGHASAAYFYKIIPKEIGAGMYLFFPVFYADVTDAWCLSSMQRIVTNLAGVYMQLLINVGLVSYIYFGADVELIRSIQQIAILNIITIFANLNPFFKFDGYWIYADLFNIPNLRARSIAWLGQASFFRKTNHRNENTVSFPLKIYSIGFVFFIAFLSLQFVNQVPHYISETLKFVKISRVSGVFDINFYCNLVQHTLGTFIIIYFAWSVLKAGGNGLKNILKSKKIQ